MRYQFEYFHIYKGKLLLGGSIESMEVLLELAAVERSREARQAKKSTFYSSSSARVANPPR